jgi:hypothetical protein
VTVPPWNGELERAPESGLRPPRPTRTFARTETFIPMKPAAALASEPTRKPNAYHLPRNTSTISRIGRADLRDGPVLARQERLGAAADRRGDLVRALAAGRGRDHAPVEPHAHDDGGECGDHGEDDLEHGSGVSGGGCRLLVFARPPDGLRSPAARCAKLALAAQTTRSAGPGFGARGKLEEQPRIRTYPGPAPRRALTLGLRTPNSRFSARGARLSRCIVVVPTYNEAENLPLLVPEVLAQDPRIEVLVVDDDSPDGTGKRADDLAHADPRVHVLHRPHKQGPRPGLSRGIARALELGADWVVQMDADFSHPPAMLVAMLAEIERLRRGERLALHRRHHRGELADRADPDQLFRQTPTCGS